MTKLAPPTPSGTSTDEARASHVTFEQFLSLGGDPHVEWVNGKVVPMPAVADEHAGVSLFFLCAMQVLADKRKLGLVRHEPFQMKTGPDLPSRSPDVLFLATKNLKRHQRMYIDGPADLVIEVISPESRGRDRGEKFYEYEQGGVREYWLIDPYRREAEFYRRDRGGIFRLVAPDQDGIVHSKAMPGLWVRVDWLWQRPTPPVADALAALGLM